MDTELVQCQNHADITHPNHHDGINQPAELIEQPIHEFRMFFDIEPIYSLNVRQLRIVRILLKTEVGWLFTAAYYSELLFDNVDIVASCQVDERDGEGGKG